jgi:hypothetical protein
MKKTLLAATICLLPCAALHAQEQTVENAQKFLSIVLPGNGYMGGAMRETPALAVKAAREADSQHYYDADLQGEAKIVDADPVSRCTSKMLADYSTVTINIRARRYSSGPVVERASRGITDWGSFSAGADGRRTIGGRQEGFSWSEVKSVQQTGGDVHLMFAGNQHLATIYLRSEDLAKRVAYAIEFLRMQCDAAAGTGF